MHAVSLRPSPTVPTTRHVSPTATLPLHPGSDTNFASRGHTCRPPSGKRQTNLWEAIEGHALSRTPSGTCIILQQHFATLSLTWKSHSMCARDYRVTAIQPYAGNTNQVTAKQQEDLQLWDNILDISLTATKRGVLRNPHRTVNASGQKTDQQEHGPTCHSA